MKFYPDNRDKVNKLRWYSLKRVFSFCVKFMYIIGGRRYGKTYSIKTFLIKDFIKNGHKFAWIRSTDTALEKIRQPLQFFGRMQNLKELGVEKYDISKDTIYINGKIAGYLFAVSTFHNIKGADYDCINGCWDEFMRAKGERPVTGKREKFFDLVESIFRNTGARIFLISNSTNQFDEVLEPFAITLNDYGCYLYREKQAIIHYVQPSKEHSTTFDDSLSFLGMTDQEKKMVVDNKFTSYGDYGKQPKGKYLYSLQVDDAKFLNLYLNSIENLMYIKSGLIDSPTVYTLESEYVNSNVKRLSAEGKKILKRYYDNGKIIFYDGYCRTMFQATVE